MFQLAGKPDAMPGLLTDRGVVSIADAVPAGAAPQATMTGIIDNFDRLRPSLERLAREGKAIPASDVQLRPPLPRPGKILACIANYWEHGALEARPLNMFLKSSDAVIGPGDTIVLPEFTEPWIFMHEAELALVIKGPAKSVKRDNWRNAVFGYTGMIDVSARGEGRRTWKAGSWLGKSFDTWAPTRRIPRPSSATGLRARAEAGAYRASARASRPPASRISPGSNGGSRSKISRSTPARSSVCRARESGRSQRSSIPANTVTMNRSTSRPAAARSSRAVRTRSPSRGCIACVLNPSAWRPAMPAIRGPKPPTMIGGEGSGFRNPDCPDQSRRMTSIASTTRRARISSRSTD